MELRIFIRQLQQYNIQGTPIIYTGTSPYNLVATPNTPLPTSRQFPDYPNFIDITTEVSDLNKLKISWSIQRDQQGVVIPGSEDILKGVSGSLTFEGQSYKYLKQWLTEDVSASLNAVEVKVLDTSCGYFEGFVIKPSDLQWCETGLCEFQLNLKQADEQLNCIKRTLITDNWQGWFQKEPLNGKRHPRFSYCVEQRPNGTMIMMWWLAGVVMMPTLFVMIPLLLLLNSVIFAINGLIAVVNLFTGQPINTGMIPFINFNDIIDQFSQFYIESAGCGREHPAPLIRDYITNVCDRCNVLVDNITAPIFFAPTITIETSSNGLITKDNPHYNACYFYPQVKRGVRRFDSLNIFGGANLNLSQWWIPDNDPLLTLDLFLDELKTIYNAEWRVRGGKLYFQRKDYYLLNNYVYDFTKNSDDRLKILEGICFEPNELKYPSYIKGLYQTDPSDMNEAGGENGSGQMNGILSVGNIDDNPNYEGFLDKTVQFGATKFNLDGASQCYYYDAMQVVANGAVFTPFAPLQMKLVAGAFRDYADYAILMQGETCALPKILIWDGGSFENAKAIKIKSVTNGISAWPMPTINPVYNLNAENWDDRHEPIYNVTGDNLTLGTPPFGVYRVTDYFGIIITQNPAILVNYPMYFEPFYQETMWDWFHWIDDPKKNPVMNFNWRVKIKLCCEDLQKLGVLLNAQDIVLGQMIKLPFGYYQDGVLREITVNFDVSDIYGQYIELSGTL